MKLLNVILTTLAISFFSTNLLAFNAKEEIKRIFLLCNDKGFIVCDKEFSGPNRGMFHFPIEIQKLKIAEKDFSAALKQHYNKEESYFNAYLVSAKLDIDTTITFDSDKLDSFIESVTKQDNGIYVAKLSSGQIFILLPVEKKWKLGVPNSEEKKFIGTEQHSIVLLAKLKRKILEYHIELIKLNKPSKEDIVENVNKGIASIVVSMNPDAKNNILVNMVVKDINVVANFYFQFKTKQEMREYIQSTNKSS